MNLGLRFILCNRFFHPNFLGGLVVGERHHCLVIYLCHGNVFPQIFIFFFIPAGEQEPIVQLL